MLLIRKGAGALLPFALLAVTGCDSGPSDEEVRTGTSGMEPPVPGLYTSTSTLTRLDLPGAGEEEAERMREALGMGTPQESEICLTEEDSAAGYEGFLSQMQDDECRMESFESGTTRLRATMECPAAGGATSRLTLTGIGSATTSRMELELEQEAESIPGGSIVMQFVVENRRIGDCPVE